MPVLPVLEWTPGARWVLTDVSEDYGEVDPAQKSSTGLTPWDVADALMAGDDGAGLWNFIGFIPELKEQEAINELFCRAAYRGKEDCLVELYRRGADVDCKVTRVCYIVGFGTKFKRTMDPLELALPRNRVEKALLRDAFRYLPELESARILDRGKERFSDGCGYSYVPALLKHWTPVDVPMAGALETKEAYEAWVYQQWFDKAYPGLRHLIVKRELPGWCGKSQGTAQGILDPPLPASKEDDMIGPYLQGIVHNLLVEQRVNVLDKTKCSTSARNIYNYLCGDGTMQYNNNLSEQAPNLSELASALDNDEPRVFYVHFDHLTNETSHYFIIIHYDKRVLLLQSAVFEHNIDEWLHPKRAMKDAAKNLEHAIGMHDETDTRQVFVQEQVHQDYARQCRIYENIMACQYSSGRTHDVKTFMEHFLPLLQSLEGSWTEEDLPTRCRTYQDLFACELPMDLIRAQVRMGVKEASVKFVSAPLRSSARPA